MSGVNVVGGDKVHKEMKSATRYFKRESQRETRSKYVFRERGHDRNHLELDKLINTKNRNGGLGRKLKTLHLESSNKER